MLRIYYPRTLSQISNSRPKDWNLHMDPTKHYARTSAHEAPRKLQRMFHSRRESGIRFCSQHGVQSF